MNEFNEEKATWIDLGMCNLDLSIDEGLADALREEPGLVYGRHAGLNFNGLVYFLEGKYHEDVYVYGSKVATIEADSLEELMEKVNDEYGYD